MAPEAATPSSEDLLNRATPSATAQSASASAYIDHDGATPSAANDSSQQTTETTQTTSGTPDAHPNRKISNTAAALMIVVGIVFDLVGMVPILGSITSGIGAPLIFGMWFVMLGVPLLTPKKVASWGLSWIVEIIPALGNVLPLVTVGVALVIIIDRVEEKTGFNVTGLVKGNVTKLADVGENLKGQAKAKVFGGATPTLKGSSRDENAQNDNTGAGATRPLGNLAQFRGNNTVSNSPKIGDTGSTERIAA